MNPCSIQGLKMSLQRQNAYSRPFLGTVKNGRMEEEKNDHRTLEIILLDRNHEFIRKETVRFEDSKQRVE